MGEGAGANGSMNFILDHFIEFIIAYIIVSIGVRIWFAVSLSAAKRDIRKFDTLFDTVKSRISELEDALKTIQKRIAALEEAGSISPEQAPAAAEDRQTDSDRQTEAPLNLDVLYDRGVQEIPQTAAEPQPAGECEQPVLAGAAQSEKPETPAAPPLSAFSVWLKKQCSIESVISKLGILLLLIGIGSVFKLLHSPRPYRERNYPCARLRYRPCSCRTRIYRPQKRAVHFKSSLIRRQYCNILFDGVCRVYAL